jgi:hypothetical protein
MQSCKGSVPVLFRHATSLPETAAQVSRKFLSLARGGSGRKSWLSRLMRSSHHVFRQKLLVRSDPLSL